jgi:hypothetical protein
MANYHRINLPKNPLREGFVPKINGIDFWHVYNKDLDKIINQETLNALAAIGLVPSFIAMFVALKDRSENDMFIHKDLHWHNEQWLPFSCAINWELNSTTTSKSYWWDMTKCMEYRDYTRPEKLPYPHNLLNGIGYGHGGIHNSKNNGILDGAVLLDSIELPYNDYPILFRTDIPHSVSFASQGKRYNLSMRFSLDSIKDWDHAEQVFKDMLQKRHIIT